MKLPNFSFLTDVQIRRTLIDCYVTNLPELTKEEVGERIAEFTRRQYSVVFGNREIRLRNMNTEQRRKLRLHQISTIRMLLSNTTEGN